jgi:hypothetical protein
VHLREHSALALSSGLLVSYLKLPKVIGFRHDLRYFLLPDHYATIYCGLLAVRNV